MCWALRFGFGVGVVPIDAFQVCLKLLLDFHGKDPVALRLRCIIAHQMLFSPSFQRENMTMGIPRFHGKNRVEFRI